MLISTQKELVSEKIQVVMKRLSGLVQEHELPLLHTEESVLNSFIKKISHDVPATDGMNLGAFWAAHEAACRDGADVFCKNRTGRVLFAAYAPSLSGLSLKTANHSFDFAYQEIVPPHDRTTLINKISDVAQGSPALYSTPISSLTPDSWYF